MHFGFALQRTVSSLHAKHFLSTDVNIMKLIFSGMVNTKSGYSDRHKLKPFGIHKPAALNSLLDEGLLLPVGKLPVG